MTVRIQPLNARFTKMKLDHFEHYKNNGFKDYLSPWIPISSSNIGQLKKGTLCIDDMGLEIPFGEKRSLELVVKGKILEKRHLECVPTSIKFAFAEPGSPMSDNLINNNEHFKTYAKYSELMGLFLKQVQKTKAVEPIQFPLFHGTNMNSAKAIKTDGIDILVTTSNPYFPYGFAFYNVSKPEETYQVDHKTGAILQLEAKDKNNPPLWLNVLRSGEVGLGNFLLNLHKYIDADTAKYTWQIVCKELFKAGLPLTAFHDGITYVFEPYEGIKVARVIEPQAK